MKKFYNVPQSTQRDLKKAWDKASETRSILESDIEALFDALQDACDEMDGFISDCEKEDEPDQNHIEELRSELESLEDFKAEVEGMTLDDVPGPDRDLEVK